MRVPKYDPIPCGNQLTFIAMALLMLAFLTEVSAQSAFFTQSFDPNTSKISVLPLQNWGLFHKSDTVSIQTSDGSSVRVFNPQGTTVYQGPPGTLPALPVDHYFVECPGDRAQFCVLPYDYQGASFLGADAADGTDSGYSQRLNQIHPTWVRALTEGQWPIVEPMPGVWDWDSLDATVAANSGRKIIVTAFIRPSWLTDNSQFLPQFLTYVTAMAQRYDGRIYAIQIWNEPWVETVTANGLAWGDIGNPVTGNMGVDLPVWEQTLATLIAASKQAIRNVSSSIKVFGPDWQSLDYANLVQGFVGMAGSQALDAYTFHADTFSPVSELISSADGTNELATLITPYVGTSSWMVTEFHPFGASALGIPQTGADPGIPSLGISWQRGMNRLIQSVVSGRADGAEAIIPHVMPLYGANSNDNWEVYGWELGGAYSRGPHPKTSAYLMTGYWLNNATFVDARTPGQQVFLYAWKRPDNSSLVFAWTAEGQIAALQPNPAFTVTDIFGQTNQFNSLTETPVLFSSATLSPSALLSNVLGALTQNYSVPPVWQQPINNQSVQVGQTLQFTVSAFDPNRAPITYSATPLPDGALLDPVTGVFSWTPSAAQIGSYDITVTARDDQGRSAATLTTIDVVGDLLDGLADHWKFDEGTGTTTADSSGPANGVLANFAFASTSGWMSGLDGNALSFDGAGSFVSLPSNDLNFTNNFTVSTWLYPRDASGEGAFISVRCGYQQSGFRFFIANDSLTVQGQTTTGWKWAPFGSIQNGNWYHVAVVYDKSTVRAFINGVYQGSAYWGGDLVMDPNGASQIGTQGGYYFDGLIDEMMIFNRTLSAQEVLRLYQLVHGSPATVPILAPIGAKKVPARQTLAFRVSVTDSNSAAVTYSATPLPAGATFNSTNGTFIWSPQTNQVGLYSLTFAASNSQLSDSETVSITVVKSNSAPVLKPIKPKRVHAGRHVRIALKAKDRDRDSLTYSMESLPSGATFDPIKHRLEWTPTPDQIGQFDLTANVTDGYVTSSQPMSITVY
jgi:hypothetical protein